MSDAGSGGFLGNQSLLHSPTATRFQVDGGLLAQQGSGWHGNRVRAMEQFLLPGFPAEGRKSKDSECLGTLRGHTHDYLLDLRTVMCNFICNPFLLSAQTSINILVKINVSGHYRYCFTCISL